MTPEERESIIQEAVERALRVMPEVIGNLMAANTMYAKLNKDFYGKNPDLVNHKKLVAEVVAQVEGKNPLRSYEEILKDSLPEIRSRLSLTKATNDRLVKKEELNLSINGLI